MKLISNILITLVLIIYVFTPIFDCGILSNITGLKFTELIINFTEKADNELFAVLPFIGCFLAILFNCLKNRYWSVVSLVCLLSVAYFYVEVRSFTGTIDYIFNIRTLGWGYYLAAVVLALSFVSTALVLVPLKRGN